VFDLGLRWGYFGGHGGDFGITLGWLGRTLGSFWVDEGDVGAPWLVLNALWAHFGSIWCHLGTVFVIWRCFWDTLKWFWSHFEIILGAVLACEDDLGLTITSSWVHEAEFSKNTYFPMNSNYFIQILDWILMTLGLFYKHGIDLGLVRGYFYITDPK
jgi:hypothetical protein